jgi:hypothetical protein
LAMNLLMHVQLLVSVNGSMRGKWCNIWSSSTSCGLKNIWRGKLIKAYLRGSFKWVTRCTLNFIPMCSRP